MTDLNLPEGWRITTLEEVAEIHDNLREPVNSAERSKRIGPYPYYGATGQVGWIDDYRQDGEYVLLGEDGAPFFDLAKDKAYLVSGKCWVNNHAHVLRGRDGVCLSKYLLHALNQADYRGFANGTTRLKLTQSAMRRIPINLAPVDQQERIIAKIEELFSELDNGIQSLKTAREQLKTYRQSLLKHAFEGKLTEQWRKENADKLETPEQLLAHIQQGRETRYQQQLEEWKLAVKEWESNGKEGKKPGRPRKQIIETIGDSDLDGLFDIPKQWKWVFLNELSEHIVDGTHHTPNYTDSGVPFISAKDIKDFKIDFGDTRFIDSVQHKELVRRCQPRKNSVLLTKSGTIGRVALVDKDLDFSLFESVANIPILGDLQGRFLMWAVYFQVSSYFGEKNQKGVAIRHLHLEDIRRLPIPLPSYNEQIEFIERIDNIFDRISENEFAIDNELFRSEILRQSILKKAFSGQLARECHD